MLIGRKYMFKNLEKKQAVESDLQMAQITLDLAGQNIKTTIINMLKTLNFGKQIKRCLN